MKRPYSYTENSTLTNDSILLALKQDRVHVKPLDLHAGLPGSIFSLMLLPPLPSGRVTSLPKQWSNNLKSEMSKS
jgi:hypothetical protein